MICVVIVLSCVSVLSFLIVYIMSQGVVLYDVTTRRVRLLILINAHCYVIARFATEPQLGDGFLESWKESRRKFTTILTRTGTPKPALIFVHVRAYASVRKACIRAFVAKCSL